MTTLLLIIIYISFISLGLPDSLIGTTWPSMQADLAVPISFAGVLSMIVTGGTIISSFFSERIIRRLGTGLVTAISVSMTAAALLGFHFAPSFIWLIFLAIPLGFGAGSIDAALNNFVAIHYEARHMSWLHCFWGIGTTIGPIIMSRYLPRNQGWKLGFGTIGIVQACLVILLFLSLPLWNKVKNVEQESTDDSNESLKLQDILKIKGVKPAFISFFSYCALEATTGLWGSSFLVMNKGISSNIAARWISLYYFGITLGRFISGFVTMKISNKQMIRLGQFIIALGVLLIIVPFGNLSLLLGFFLIGLGCAPIFPCMLHETPRRFGKNLSQALMGIQMASAYIGSTFMPPLFGTIAETGAISFFPIYLFIILLIMIVSSEKINSTLANKNKTL
ncbi:MAG: MFS transporter [Anaerocolumna sp.]